ncbi:MAG: hypothetical protein HRU33_18785 [Rhodobacteraceae bacterium]|nr:hypothetical protein [Paracoccaceae bacterium]
MTLQSAETSQGDRKTQDQQLAPVAIQTSRSINPVAKTGTGVGFTAPLIRSGSRAAFESHNVYQGSLVIR